MTLTVITDAFHLALCDYVTMASCEFRLGHHRGDICAKFLYKYYSILRKYMNSLMRM